jgi:hypothetical protein
MEPPLPPPWVLARHKARVLDPTTAVTVAGVRPVRPTVYVASRLLLSPQAEHRQALALLEATSERLGWAVEPRRGDDPETQRDPASYESSCRFARARRRRLLTAGPCSRKPEPSTVSRRCRE